MNRVADPKLLISVLDPDPTWWVISYPDPACRSFGIWILVCELFMKFLHLKLECTFLGHFCAEIKLFMLKIVFYHCICPSRGLILNGNFGSVSESYRKMG